MFLVALDRSQFARKRTVDFFYFALCSEGLMFEYRFGVLRGFFFLIYSVAVCRCWGIALN